MLHPARPRGTYHHQCNYLGCCMQEQICQTTQLCNQGWYWGPSDNFSPADNLFHSPTTLRGPFSFLKMMLWQSHRCVEQCQLHPPWCAAIASVPQSDFVLQAQAYKRYPFPLHCCNTCALCLLFLPKCRKWSPKQGWTQQLESSQFSYWPNFLRHLTGITSCLLPAVKSRVITEEKVIKTK